MEQGGPFFVLFVDFCSKRDLKTRSRALANNRTQPPSRLAAGELSDQCDFRRIEGRSVEDGGGNVHTLSC